MPRPQSASDRRRLLAQLLKQRRAASSPRQVRSERPSDGRLPLSYAQERLWLLDQLEPASSIYTIATVFQITGALRVDLLETAIGEIVRRHEALRTVFLDEQGRPYQMVQPYSPVRLPVVEIGEQSDDSPEVLAVHLAAIGAQQPFDLRTGPLFRVALLRKSAEHHVLSLDIHHIISDAWSFKLFTQELAAIYTELSRGHRPSLPEPKIQYADYCIWERECLSGQFDESLAYWKQQLAGPLPVLQLPADRVRQPRQTHRGALWRFYLPKPLVDRLRAFSQQSSVTPFMTLLATFQTLLYRYTGQEDLLVGSAFAGRNRREVHDLIGFFVNTLPLRVSLAGEPTFMELLGRVREVALAAYAHQDLPFIKLVEQLQPDRDTSYSPLVQIMFVMRQKAPAPVYGLPDVTLGRPREVDGGVAKFELSWSMEEEEEEEGFLCQLEYNADLFESARIERMGAHFVTLLTAILEQPGQSVATLPLLSEQERELVLHTWNPTPSPAPRTCFHRLFEAQVARAPEQVAVVFEGEQLTYAQLESQANQLAHHLRSLGVGRDVLVGLCLERSLTLIVSVLAVFKAGGAYVPIEPTLPSERISFVLADAQLSLVLVQPQTAGLFHAQTDAVSLVQLDELPRTESTSPLSHEEDASQLAYVIYTSGSTGKPKGVEVEHSGLHNLLQAQISTFEVTHASRTLQFASMSFDASIFEIVMALGAGATLVVSPHMTLGGQLIELLRREAVTHVTLPPSVLANLPDAELPALRTIITAGEPCPPALVERWAARHAFFNAYGPTEATVWSTVARCHVGERVTIGSPISDTQIYLLDTHQQPVPVGLPGELYISGAGLARGYLGRPELTAQRFVQAPFGLPGQRLYRTGDIARYLEDGSIDFLGRTDDQVKLRGFRIELEEIEHALQQHPAVRETVVLVRGESPEHRQLAAFYVCSEPAPDAAELRAWLQQKLPTYMVPAVFVSMAAFPLTSSNKIDRQALIVPEDTLREQAVYSPPTTAVEEIIVNIWAEVLGLERVGIHDNFFELGGHSLQATQVVSRVGEVLSQSLPLSAFFEQPTVAEFARAVVERQHEARPQLAAALEPAGEAESYALSFAQQRLWLLDSVAPGQSEYNIPTVIELRGPLDRDALRSALRGVVARHESLRTKFLAVDGVPRQIITEESLSCTVLVLAGLGPKQQEREIRHLTLAEAQRPFDLARDLLVRATLVCRQADQHVLLLTVHHIAADDRSMRIFLQELHALYSAATNDTEPDLPPLLIQYRDFAQWQRKWLTNEFLSAQLEYWERQLADLPQPTALLPDHVRERESAGAGDSASLLLPTTLVQKITRLGRQESCTLFMTALAAFQVVLGRHAAQEEVVLGTPVANRSQREIQHVIGYFGNTLVLRTDLSGRPTFRELLARVRKVALEAYEHADIPFEEVVAKLGLTRGLGPAPLLRVLFGLQDTAPAQSSIGDVAATVTETDNKTAKFELVVLVRLLDDGLLVRAQYSTRRFTHATIERLLQHFRRALEEAVASPDRAVDELPLVTEDERRRLLAWSGTTSTYPHDRCVHELVEAQVVDSPDALALVWGKRRLTYRQLDEQANQLAHHLRRLGIQPEAPVGLYLERSPEMVVSLLAILKAGGVYVPLDPSYPAERIAFMVEDAGISILLTNGRAPLGVSTSVTRVDFASEVLDHEDTGPVPHCGCPEQLAYIIYTSGSTGRPKGVAVGHRAINRLVCNTNYVKLGPEDRVAQISNASFDAATFEVWGALIHGAQLIGFDKKVVISPADLAVQLQEQRITTIFLTAALFNLISSTAPHSLRSIHHVLVGGDALDAGYVRRVLAHGKPRRLLNAYGPTEATTFAAWFLIDQLEEQAINVPIGSPISNTELYVLDSRRQLAPIGVPGELHIGGPGLARGYLNRPELTAERFVPHPLSAESGARLYKTGDLARYRDDGTIEFLRRIDHQIKLRGFRIELGEIETLLRSHPAVTEVVVLVREDIPGHKQLAAYVACEDSRQSGATELRLYLSERLPSFMVPSAFIVLPALPLSPNGKLDRKRLLEMPLPSTVADREPSAPQSQLERSIAELWREVLHRDHIDVHDNFFDLGGSSLLVPQILSRLQKLVGRKISAITIFEHTTVSSLAKFLSEKDAAAPTFANTHETADSIRASRARQAQRRRRKAP